MAKTKEDVCETPHENVSYVCILLCSTSERGVHGACPFLAHFALYYPMQCACTQSQFRLDFSARDDADVSVAYFAVIWVAFAVIL
eukprot:5201432-Amphidinium_carterae.1